MKTLESVTRFSIPPAVADETDAQLRAAGRDGYERFVLWTGFEAQGVFTVHTLHVPKQTSSRSAEGLCVHVDGTELHRLNLWLFEHHELLGVQIHSHPMRAYHSDTDSTFPIVTMRGGLSLVVPNFGREGLRGGNVASYRLGVTGWDELTSREAERLIRYEG